MEDRKTIVDTMDESAFVFGGKFYNVVQCEPEIDPCLLCEVDECPFRDCPFARFYRYLKEMKHIPEDIKLAAEKSRKDHPEASFLAICKEDITSKENHMETPKTTFRDIAGRIADLQEKKNESYGNAFEQSCDKYGVVSALTRLNDKLNRLDSLYKSSEQSAFGESFSDTLTDLAAYAIMTIEWLENRKNNENP